jgi:hypothetical protein
MSFFPVSSFALVVFIIGFSGCSTTPERQVSAVKEDEPKRPMGYFERDPHGGSSDPRRAFCDGTKTKFLLKFTTEYWPPKIPGVFVDEAAESQKKLLSGLRSYLKNEFWYEAFGERYYGAFFDPEKESQYEFFHEFYSQYYSLEYALLLGSTTFILPKDVIAKMKGVKNFSSLSLVEHYYGYPDGKFSASSAFYNKDMLWKLVIESGTKLQEAAIDDKRIRFIVTLDLSLFCQYGVAIDELRSK